MKPTPVLILAGLLLSAGPLTAASLPRVSARDRLVRAELIFEGVVTRIEHRNAEVAGPGQVAFPHTFVTFSIERTFKGGSVDGKRITLRFRGGPDGSGLVYFLPGIPDFVPGDREVLFVRGNGQAYCPLIGWEQGRLRVVRDRIFDQFGRELWIAPAGDFVFGEPRIDTRAFPYPALPVPDNPQEPSDSVEARPDWAPPTGAAHPDADGFRRILGQMILGLAARGELGPVTASPSPSPEHPFTIEALAESAPPRVPERTSTGPIRGASDAREAELIRRQLAQQGR